MKKSILALAVTLAAVSGAHAAWDTGYNAGNTTVGNGEAVFEAYDLTAGKSYILDLGVRYDDLMSGAAFNGQTFTVDLSVFAGSASGNTVWQIVAGSGDKRNAANTANDFSTYGFITSADASVTTLASTHTTSVVAAVLGSLNQINTTVGMVSGNTAVNDAVTESAGFGPKFYAAETTTGLIQGSFSVDTSGEITGETMNLWRYGFGTASTNKSVIKLGSANLTGNTLTLGTAPTPTVPVPAAAWLMGSALLGLTGVARRRNKA